MDGLAFESGLTANEVTHEPYRLGFQNDFGSAPLLFAQMQTIDGGDVSNVRYTSLNQDRAWILIEEEQSDDSETIHTSGVVGYFAMDSGALGRGLPHYSHGHNLVRGNAAVTPPASTRSDFDSFDWTTLSAPDHASTNDINPGLNPSTLFGSAWIDQAHDNEQDSRLLERLDEFASELSELVE